MNTDNFNMQQIKLTLIQPGFNPHPKVGYVNQFTIQIRAFTCIRFSLIFSQTLLTVIIVDNYCSAVSSLDTGDATTYCHKKPFTWLRYIVIGDENFNTL